MSVELTAKKHGVLGLGVANGTWFHLLRHTKVGDVLGRSYGNDPLDVSADDAAACAAALADFAPPEGWGLIGEGGNEKMKAFFIEFFNECGGFTTH